HTAKPGAVIGGKCWEIDDAGHVAHDGSGTARRKKARRVSGFGVSGFRVSRCEFWDPSWTDVFNPKPETRNPERETRNPKQRSGPLFHPEQLLDLELDLILRPVGREACQR